MLVNVAEDPEAIREMLEVVNPEKHQSHVCGARCLFAHCQDREEHNEKVTGSEQPGISETIQRQKFHFLFEREAQLLFVLFMRYPSDSTAP